MRGDLPQVEDRRGSPFLSAPVGRAPYPDALREIRSIIRNGRHFSGLAGRMISNYQLCYQIFLAGRP